MNIFLDGISFKYKREIILQGIDTYDEVLKKKKGNFNGENLFNKQC
jgi:hypothetical protein